MMDVFCEVAFNVLITGIFDEGQVPSIAGFLSFEDKDNVPGITFLVQREFKGKGSSRT